MRTANITQTSTSRELKNKKPLEEFNQQEALDQQSNKIVTHSLTCDERGRSESSSA
ncbi:hypothetical protein ABZU02_04165 [Gardnerella piotii]|uniref:Uncharacterized protein n=1 Tax=Gardnerella piotii TaxID=2792977 RepID=A0AAU8NKL6_9BIFI